MSELESILAIAESVTLFGFMFLGLRYIDSLRKEERSEVDDRTKDIVDDWKRMRQLDD